jgi:hypothetical protein
MHRLVCLGLAFGLIAQVPTRAGNEPLEYQVKAAFLLNFTKFVEWPASAFDAPESPLAICILGEDPFGSTLDQIVEGEVVKGRKLIVQRLKRMPTPKACQVLFISNTAPEVPKLLSSLRAPVLTIGERASFIREGGMVAFLLENRRVRFGISKTNAEAAGLRLSSKLLSVARSVEQ